MRNNQMLLATLFLVLLTCEINGNFVHNNVCDNPLSYSLKYLNPRCHYNPDVHASMEELITRQGYAVRSYDAITKDGYILKVFNIPKENPKGVLLLQHPTISWSNIWVDVGNTSLGFALSNAGYDVWMGNFRGTYHSRRHTTLNPDKDYLQYWNFTFYEMGIYDIPALVDLIVKETNAKQITFIGHSVAGMAAVIYGSMQNEHASNNIKKFILMAPAVFMQYFSPYLRPFGPVVSLLYNLFGNTPLAEIGSYNGLLHKLAKLICTSEAIGVVICQKILTLSAGGRRAKIIDWEQIPVMFGQNIAGISLKTLVHYAQIFERAEPHARFYDYGKQLNRLYYNSDDAPFFPLEKFNSSLDIIAGTLDLFATFKDCTNFYNFLVKNSDTNPSFASVEYGHIDFHYSNNLETQINKPILKILDSLYEN